MTLDPHRLRLGTRASDLARWQADWVTARLAELAVSVDLVPVTTSGDRQQAGPVAAIGIPGVFTKEIQRALLDDRIDLAVHSLKDLPTDPVDGLCLAAVPERASPSDSLVCRVSASFNELPKGASVGTGSLRRRAQLLHARPDLRMLDIRGNVDTRLRKLDQGDFDAIVLAEAGLRRLGMGDRITQGLSPIVLPAVGQGALGLETRTADHDLRELLEKLNHPPTHTAVLAERALLAALEGGCLAPIAAWGRVEDGMLVLTGRVIHPEGREMIEITLTGDASQAEQLGNRVADELTGRGATALIQAARQS